MVTITNYGHSTCIWCAKQKEGVELSTKAGTFAGFLCFTDLKRMLRLTLAPDTEPATVAQHGHNARNALAPSD
jgi:DNA-binding helix-hairpin-helix protein with protein kinase domain